MNIAGLRSIGSAVLLVLLAGAGCNRPKRASSESSAAPTPQAFRASITAHAPDEFYDPPSDPSHQPGVLLRSEPLKDVMLPAGIRGWRILYATTVDDNTPATAVATVFAPTDPPAGPRPVVAWEHATTGLLQKCMPSLFWSPLRAFLVGRIVKAGWVVVATDASFAEKGGPHASLIGEGELSAALGSNYAVFTAIKSYARQTMVMWGYSQGGHAALQQAFWTALCTGARNPRRRPGNCTGRKRFKNILAINVEADKRFGPYLALGVSRFYPDITFDQALLARGGRCSAADRKLTCDFSPPEDAERIEALAATFDGPALADGLEQSSWPTPT